MNCLPRPLQAEDLEARLALSATHFIESDVSLGIANHLVLADIDGDSVDDALLGREEGVEVLLNDGVGNLNTSGQFLSGIAHDTAVGDVDADGDHDVITVCGCVRINQDRIWLNDGAGTLSENGELFGNGLGFALALGDLDNDLDLDFVVTDENFLQPRHQLKVWSNEGSSRFSLTGAVSLSVGSLFELSIQPPALADLDGDEDLDMIAGLIDAPSRVWINDGLGNFVDTNNRIGNATTQRVVLADLDGDGDSDAYVQNNGPDGIWLNDGLGHFIDTGQRFGQLSQSVALGDLDLDGDTDVYLANGYINGDPEPDRVLFNDGNGRFLEGPQAIGDSHSVIAALADIDADGRLDVIVGTHEDTTVWFNVSQADVDLAPGDANADLRFDQHDIVQVLQAGKYLTGQPATFAEGDWNNDGLFNQEDIVAAMQTGRYRQG